MAEVKKAKTTKVKKSAAVSAPTSKKANGKCTDKKCPFHAGLSVRGRSFTGEIIRKREKTVKVEWPRHKYFPKYERYARLSGSVIAHLPDCISPEIEIGDKVKITECRPLSRMKHVVVVEKIKE